MNVLDILKSVISVNSDNVFIEKYISHDYRCTVFNENTITINNIRLTFQGRAFHYIFDTETLNTFWGCNYHCNQEEFNTFLKSLNIPNNNIVSARFKSLSEEIEITQKLGLEYEV